MKVIKNVNNNVAICVDDDGNELVAFGNGIGFKQPPYTLSDLSIISRTFYNVDERYLNLLTLIPEKYFSLSAKIVDYAKSKLKRPLSSNIVFTMADHIQFTIQREEKGLALNYFALSQIKNLNPIEYDIGRYAVALINSTLDKDLNNDEALAIAVHILNAEEGQNLQIDPIKDQEKAIDHIFEIIENYFHVHLKREGFNYSRFVTHLEYLLQKNKLQNDSSSQNQRLYDELIVEYPNTFACVNKICSFLENFLQTKMSKEEKVYLILHVNRLLSRDN